MGLQQVSLGRIFSSFKKVTFGFEESQPLFFLFRDWRDDCLPLCRKVLLLGFDFCLSESSWLTFLFFSFQRCRCYFGGKKTKTVGRGR